jgi:DNA polymerase I-like protein with 3'-5' exonuclease and polymerase domains
VINDYANKYLVETVSDLPNLKGAQDIYLDFETTSGSKKEDSKNPWRNCDILGICITVDNDPRAFYIPLQHQLNPEQNLPAEPVYKWLRDIVKHAKRWINSNVKYDVHVGVNYAGLEVSHLQLLDTVTLGKIIDSDLFSYGLKELSKKWLGHDISEFEKGIRVYTHSPKNVIKNRDYGCIPIYDMYKYGTQDALSTRTLFKYIQRMLPTECKDTWDAEIALTPVLTEIERNGLHIDIQKVGFDFFKKIPKILANCEDKLKKLTGERFRPHVAADCADILCSRYQLPVIAWTDDKKNPKPQIDKHALIAYKTYENSPIEVIELIERYRHYHHLKANFTYPYIKKYDPDTLRMNGTFNQSVRTGRMSMSDPNMQQVSPDAKRYVLPGKEFSLMEFDLSQIEYRYVASFTENSQILEQYRSSRDADYHQIMADLCGIDRAPAKNMNFATSFRAGKKKVISMLRSAFNIEDVPNGHSFDEFVDAKGAEVFSIYHRRFPELKKEWQGAQAVCKRRGYCRNIFGRRRHLTNQGSYMAFPNIVQSSAADLMKRITVRLQDLVRGQGPMLNCIVHDSWLFEIPKGEEDHWEKEIKECIESTESRLKVPLYASADRSNTNWSECK